MNAKRTGVFLKEMRIQKRISLEEMSKALKVTIEEIAKWEMGESYPDSKEMTFIADMLGVTVENIYSGYHVRKKMNKTTADTLIMGASVSILAGVLSFFLLRSINLEVSILSVITFASIGVLTILYVGLKTE